MPRVPSAAVQQMMNEDRVCARYLERIKKQIHQRLCSYSKAQGVGVDGLDGLVDEVVASVRFDLRGPCSQQLVMLDRDDATGSLGNPRLTELPAEEAMFPVDDDGEELNEGEAVCDLVVGVPLLAWLPEM